MYKWLYDNFSHWFHNGRGQVWFYSDPHFADDEVKHLRTNYIGDDEQVRRINSKLGKWDTLVILGDVGDAEWVKKLRGYKVLVMGNHDSGASNYKRMITEDETQTRIGQDKVSKRLFVYNPTTVDNHLFDEVYEGPLFISDKILLSHEPIDFPYALNIHGHDHSLLSKGDDLHWNVCAEHIDYTPVCLKTIATSGRLGKIDSIHRDTIDRATERKYDREREVQNKDTNKDTETVSLVIDKIIASEIKKPTKEEAMKSLRACGILDNQNKINPAYRGIIIERKEKRGV